MNRIKLAQELLKSANNQEEGQGIYIGGGALLIIVVILLLILVA